MKVLNGDFQGQILDKLLDTSLMTASNFSTYFRNNEPKTDKTIIKQPWMVIVTNKKFKVKF